MMDSVGQSKNMPYLDYFVGGFLEEIGNMHLQNFHYNYMYPVKLIEDTDVGPEYKYDIVKYSLHLPLLLVVRLIQMHFADQ